MCPLANKIIIIIIINYNVILSAKGVRVIIVPIKQQVASLTWCLSTTTNNEEKDLAILQGLTLLISTTLATNIVMGGSMLIIKALKGNNANSYLTLSCILQRTKLLSQRFHEVSYYYILCNNNSVVNAMAN